MTEVTGWDIGGAHLKAARVENGRVVDVVQQPALIWTDTGALETALDAALERFAAPALHCVTMTGELAELFGDRATGVARLVALVTERLAGKTVRIYAGRAGFLAPAEAVRRAHDVASANWHASAAWAARARTEALFVDIGSTTTDLIPIAAHVVAAEGQTDADRLTAGELVYTGATRTPVMALATRVPFTGRWQTLMGEQFATAADVYRILGLLDEAQDQLPAIDGRDKSVDASTARLARMLGRDAQDAAPWQWREVCHYLRGCQLAALEEAARLVLSRTELGPDAPVIGCGTGDVLARPLAGRLSRPYVPFADLVECGDATRRQWVNACAPSVAVALLGADANN